MRILVLIAIGLLLYVIISNLLRKNRPATPPKSITEKMVKCEHCGLHILQQEAIQSEDHFYCSQEHLEAHRRSE
ncbi:MAG: hypothetical protein DRQ39_01805 [Gammaproteobacteria bacterium]|nr:MAG: hypothetical protein DRQ39_01805 [Gammaproteobacteria bacterium]RKZ94714.1 MAG: hypothetical protein DRQ40_05275 [Gammaproteobacteria bacterium]RKZ97528.1 MAG: hypothetical protein DRQ42_09510 [Gammaproteobacteria bacterium]RKZ98114.1 MAG: hypothetical protein DRQ46_02995 [Gammaproteobacteria bacterium]HHA19236.1 hypothetical protein [Methylophaga sp.]